MTKKEEKVQAWWLEYIDAQKASKEVKAWEDSLKEKLYVLIPKNSTVSNITHVFTETERIDNAAYIKVLKSFIPKTKLGQAEAMKDSCKKASKYEKLKFEKQQDWLCLINKPSNVNL